MTIKDEFYGNSREHATWKSALIFEGLRLISKGKHDIVLENLALCQQLVVQQRSTKKPKIKNRDRIFWIWLSRFWNNWGASLIIVSASTQPAVSACESPFAGLAWTHILDTILTFKNGRTEERCFPDVFIVDYVRVYKKKWEITSLV